MVAIYRNLHLGVDELLVGWGLGVVYRAFVGHLACPQFMAWVGFESFESRRLATVTGGFQVCVFTWLFETSIGTVCRLCTFHGREV